MLECLALIVMQIDEEGFDSSDNLVVVLLGSGRIRDYPKTQIEKLKSIVPAGVKICYTVKEGSDSSKPPVMLYKGTRKKFYATIDLSDKSQFENMASEMASFFKAVSQDFGALRQDPKIPEYVTHDTFREKVIKEATAKAPIVLQLYEDSCFLCFLMRPFINSINRHLQEIKSPVRLKRLNIERNDFPDGCPVTRATPTFVVYDGHAQGSRWSEFRPKDFVAKLVELAKLDEKSQIYLNKLTEDISERFLLFGRWARWVAEAQIIQESVLTKAPVDEEEVNTRALRMLMDMDMDRTDDLETNLKVLRKEIISAEQDCIAVSEIMATEIIKQEKKYRTEAKSEA
ncbi:thioredoxin [Babesia ovata]|uniref:Thioredoxin n=1 Tax=Babesia ovata TaxID=189622 RepID=A0A2H6KH45_9APIC|nr:thioredoxin [Babesia ovata]GBE62307.1 thioredoxin [Babesia ovata]